MPAKIIHVWPDFNAVQKLKTPEINNTIEDILVRVVGPLKKNQETLMHFGNQHNLDIHKAAFIINLSFNANALGFEARVEPVEQTYTNQTRFRGAREYIGINVSSPLNP